MSDNTQPDAGENATRAALRRLGARPVGHADDEDDEQPTPPPAPVPTGAGRRGAPRLPHWWSTHRRPIVSDDDGDGQTPPPAGPPAPAPKPQQAPADPYDDEDDYDEPEDAGEGQPPRKRFPRLRRSHGQRTEPTRPPFATAVPLYGAPEKKSLAELVREIKPHQKWLLFAGTGFGTGWYFGIPQFVTAATASVAHHGGRLQDNPDVYFWGVAALIVISLDRATRRSWFVLAWLTRALTVCVVVGAVLYGNPIEL
ncbi:hypothetical protein [Streptomyces sp. NPDC001165]|uniref:hypothetical protein n=1 Tax=Streptomyces sp. NPDC001165 TaxID=3364546 RepID=UPI0036877EBD